MIENKNMMTADYAHDMFWDAFDRYKEYGALDKIDKKFMNEVLDEYLDAQNKFVDEVQKCINRLILGV